MNNTTHRAFDALNRLYKITDPESGITTTSYDAHDRPLTITAPTGGNTTYVYDGFGDLIQETSPNSRATVYYYESTGNLIERASPTGAVTQYTYDALDRVLTMSFPSDSFENVTYSYDQSGHGYSIGRLTSMTDAGGSVSRSYDQLGNLLTDDRTKNQANLNSIYTYDAANRIASITYPSGALVSYSRDSMGQITSVTAKPSGGTSTSVVSSVAYEPFGPYSGLTFGNGVAETRSFDQDYRLTVHTDAGTNTLQSLSYGYYPTNSLQTITDGVTSGNSQTFSYDNLQRLSQATGGYGTYGFTYDKDGNRLTQTLGGVTTHYSYGTGNDLLTTMSMGGVTTQTINYTGDGNMANLSPGVQAPGGLLITALGWNQNARLSAVKSGSNVLARYDYDGFGQRVVKTISTSNVTLYQYGQDGMLLEEATYQGVPLADYIYLNGGPVATLTPSGTLYFLHDDLLGTPQLATDSSQSPTWQVTYQPFGKTSSVSGTITQNLRLPGQYLDLEGGWNHNGFRNYFPDLGRYAEPDPLAMQGSARYYDPQTGRFLSKDPFRTNVGASIYAYVDNNPTTFIDPFGYDVWLEGPSGNEPAGHLSINVGNPNGNYDSYSFGVNGDPGLGGEVYKDTSLGGNILPDYYLKTTSAQDALVKQLLDTQLGNKAPYRPWRTCRNFSETQFQKIKDLGIGTPAPAPYRPPAPGAKPWTVPSTSTTSAWDQLNLQRFVENIIGPITPLPIGLH